MRILPSLVVASLFCVGAAAECDPPPETEHWTDGGVACWKIYEPERVLRWEMVVPATPAEVWAAWTVPEELTKWAAPGAEVDLREGGTWEVHFFPDRPPGERGSDANHILGVEDGHELRIAAGAPPEYPTVRAEKTEFVVRLEPVGEAHTLVVIEQRGWKSGEEWQLAFEDLANKNAQWLNLLHRRFVSGPMDWSALGGG